MTKKISRDDLIIFWTLSRNITARVLSLHGQVLRKDASLLAEPLEIEVRVPYDVVEDSNVTAGLLVQMAEERFAVDLQEINLEGDWEGKEPDADVVKMRGLLGMDS